MLTFLECVVSQICREIKKRLIAEKIRAISSKFREIYCAQSTKRVKWEADEPTDARSPKLVLPGSSDDSANGHVYINSKTGKPMLLTNSVLISQQELMALMEKGFVEATEKK